MQAGELEMELLRVLTEGDPENKKHCSRLLGEFEYRNHLCMVFEPMALDWERATALKKALRDACPAINSDDFRRNPGAHKWCDR